jgi:hypothetical protein
MYMHVAIAIGTQNKIIAPHMHKCSGYVEFVNSSYEAFESDGSVEVCVQARGHGFTVNVFAGTQHISYWSQFIVRVSLSLSLSLSLPPSRFAHILCTLHTVQCAQLCICAFTRCQTKHVQKLKTASLHLSVISLSSVAAFKTSSV